MSSDRWPWGNSDGDGFDITVAGNEDEEDRAYALSSQLAEEIICLGVAATSQPAIRESGWQPGVWLDTEAARRVIAALQRLK